MVFDFGSDPLDLGEQLEIDLLPEEDRSFGFINVGTTPQRDRTICLLGSDYEDFFAETVLDGKQKFEIWMFSGSVVIESIEVVANAEPT